MEWSLDSHHNIMLPYQGDKEGSNILSLLKRRCLWAFIWQIDILYS